jgi:hypothetical protein
MKTCLDCNQILRSTLLLAFTLALSGAFAGCGKKTEQTGAATPVQDTNSAPSAAPGPLPTPAAPQTLPTADANNVDATLAQLTRELHRTMIGRKLSGSFEEFVTIRNLTVPPPPPGKKYAISKQWRVVLVDK